MILFRTLWWVLLVWFGYDVSSACAEYTSWTNGHSVCTLLIDYKSFTVDKSNIGEICHEANYMTKVNEGLKNGSHSSAFEKAVLTSILNLYDELRENRKPQLVVFAEGLMNEKRIFVHPISFGIPVKNLVTTIPHKNQVFARINIPAEHKSTYHDIDSEFDYLKDMERSLFSVAYKKTNVEGWDSMKLLEIIAAGSLPLFANIAQCPDHALVAHPKALYKHILNMPGLTMVERNDQGKKAHHFDTHNNFDMTKLDKSLYLTIVSALIQYTRNVLTTSAMAAYVLDTMFKYSNGQILTAQPRRVLFLTTHVNPPDSENSDNNMADVLLHGLKTLLGDKAVVDFPRQSSVYKTENEFNTLDYVSRKNRLSGSAFSWGLTVDDFASSRERDQSIITQNIENKIYDVIIIMGSDLTGSSGGDGLVVMSSKFLLLWDIVCKHYNPLKVGWVEGGDSPITRALLEKYGKCAGHIFSREGYAGK